jgi:hypothetical protein
MRIVPNRHKKSTDDLLQYWGEQKGFDCMYRERRTEDQEHPELRCCKCGRETDLSTIIGDQAICIHCVKNLPERRLPLQDTK